MKRFFTRKSIVFLGILAALGIAAFGAYAYYSSSGTGSGSATAGDAYTANSIALSSDSISGLYPGGAAVPVVVHVHNPNPGAAFVNQITGSVADSGSCLGSWFTVAPIAYGQDIPKGANGPDASTTVTFNDNGANQDDCQNAALTINWSSN